MTALAPTTAESTVSLEQMLAARDQRAGRQAALLARYGKPLVSMTVVMPGPFKDGPLPRRVLGVAIHELDALARDRNWSVLSWELWFQETGPEAIYVVAAEPEILKSATVELENRHPLGRLWDLDIIAPGQRPLSRKQRGAAARRCLVCDEPAHECARSRRHPLGELLNTIRKIVHEFDSWKTS